jgi:hypothetical protein
MNNKANCLICGSDIEYETTMDRKTCYYCGHRFKAESQCTEGHYVCDYCHSAPAAKIIRNFCLITTSADPVYIANEIMKHPSVSMHGPEHHFLVPAVLLTAFHNKKGTREQLEPQFEQAYERSKHVLGGFCGFYGTCGAAVGTGIFTSIITGATPISGKGWQLSNAMTAKALTCVAEAGGPRCCKRDTYIAIEEAIGFIDEHFGVKLTTTDPIVCGFSALNKQCKHHNCQFYDKEYIGE